MRPPPAPAGHPRVGGKRGGEVERETHTDHAVCGPFFLHRSSPPSGVGCVVGYLASEFIFDGVSRPRRCQSASPNSRTIPAIADSTRMMRLRRATQFNSSVMVKVLVNNVVLADSETPVILEGNYYFPPDTVKKTNLSSSDTTYVHRLLKPRSRSSPT